MVGLVRLQLLKCKLYNTESALAVPNGVQSLHSSSYLSATDALEFLFKCSHCTCIYNEYIKD